MDAFMNALIKMSLRGVVIILVVLLVRLWLKKLEIDHKYILGLWVMTFLYFIFPWKLSLSDGFWSDAGISEEIGVISEIRLTAEEGDGETVYTANSVNPAGITDNTMIDAPVVPAIPVEPAGENNAEMNETKIDVGRVIELIWLAGLS
ncbi:MAG: hypothetical protein K2J04_00235, partial [Lachnospiraceae bacterium]|nr:hypothetical protein [Lachnospiraceae bacterium]